LIESIDGLHAREVGFRSLLRRSTRRRLPDVCSSTSSARSRSSSGRSPASAPALVWLRRGPVVGSAGVRRRLPQRSWSPPRQCGRASIRCARSLPRWASAEPRSIAILPAAKPRPTLGLLWGAVRKERLRLLSVSASGGDCDLRRGLPAAFVYRGQCETHRTGHMRRRYPTGREHVGYLGRRAVMDAAAKRSSLALDARLSHQAQVAGGGRQRDACLCSQRAASGCGDGCWGDEAAGCESGLLLATPGARLTWDQGTPSIRVWGCRSARCSVFSLRRC
jgi:hypothetical protein